MTDTRAAIDHAAQMAEIMKRRDTGARCEIHNTPLDPNGQSCFECWLSLRRGVEVKTVDQIMSARIGEIAPSWERSQP